jgi:flagellar hook-associated protein 1 FlgK
MGNNIFGILQTGVSGLFVSQSGIDVTGNNIANLNTEGYSRQKPIITTESPLNATPGPFGRGAKLDSVVRTYDEVLSNTLRNETTAMSYWQNLQTPLERVQQYFNELESGTGLGDAMKDYFNAWSDLANTAPDNSDEAMVKRNALLTKADTLTQKIREDADAIEAIKKESDNNISLNIDKINNLAAKISDLNTQIARFEANGNTANDLRDSRDLLVTQLSEFVNISSSEQSDGKVAIFISGVALVDSSKANKLFAVPNNDNDGHYDIYWGYSGTDKPQINLTDKITGGSLYSDLKARDTYLKKYADELDNFAISLITTTNQLHSTGQGLKRFDQITSTNGVKNPTYLLNEDAGKFPFPVNAGTLRIGVYDAEGNLSENYDIDINPSKDSLNSIIAKISAADGDPDGGRIQAYISSNNSIKITVENGYTFAFQEDTSNFLVAAGLNSFFKGTSAKDIDISSPVKDDANFIATSLTGQPGDNQNALSIANAKYQKLNNGSTIDEFYTNFTSSIANDKSQVDTFYNTKNSIVNQLKLKLDQVQGVSIDEEYTNLIKFQKSYEASARFITAVDQMIDTLINNTGLVGR